jgi:hypothetical protein
MKLTKDGPTLHSFVCVSEEAVFIDIIGPPYNDDDRKCTYFSESISQYQESLTQQKYKVHTLEDGREIPLDITQLVKIEPNEIEYNCHTLTYEACASMK